MFIRRQNMTTERRDGRGRKGGMKPGAGLGGKCKCPECGMTVVYRTGEACYNRKCPKCGERMVRL